MSEAMSFNIRWDANQLRKRITTFLNNGDMNQTQLSKKLDVSPNSFRNFMSAKGPSGGMQIDTYAAAHMFFAKREERGLKQVTDAGAIEKAVDAIIAANPEQVAAVKEKPKTFGWFVGQVMKATGGKADGKAVTALLDQRGSSGT